MALCSQRTAPMYSSESNGKFSQFSSTYAHHTSSSSSGVSTGTSSASSASASSNSYSWQPQSSAHAAHTQAHASSVQSQSSTNQCQSQSQSQSQSQNSAQTNGDADKPIGYGAFGVVWAVTDPRDGKRVALKKLPNAFHNMTAARRVYREMMMLCTLKHENIVCASDILQPAGYDTFSEIYILTELMQTDLHRIIVSPQPLTADHVKVFLYQILRGARYLHSAPPDLEPG